MWAQIVNAIIGIGLTAAPQIFGFGKVASNVNHIVGPVVFSFAFIALSNCTRSVGRWNIVPGIGLLIGSFALNYGSKVEIVQAVVAALLIILCSFFLRKSTTAFNGGWTALWETDAKKIIS